MSSDKIIYWPQGNTVTVKKSSSRSYHIASYDDAQRWHRRGAFVIGDVPSFRVSQRTKARVLKHFYPHDSLRYLIKHGYIAC